MKKKERTNHLIWIDLEMTGLIPERDSVLEIACVVTDNDLNIIAQGPDLIIHASDEQLSHMSEWVQKHHAQSGLLDLVKQSNISLQEAENETLAFLSKNCPKEVVPLCGNSVWQDRAFMRVHMPKIAEFVHYRTIDVSSIKELVNRWYPENPYADFKKHNKHRALDDIMESIEELRYYRAHFFMISQSH